MGASISESDLGCQEVRSASIGLNDGQHPPSQRCPHENVGIEDQSLSAGCVGS